MAEKSLVNKVKKSTALDKQVNALLLKTGKGTPVQALYTLKSSAEGLTVSEAKERLKKFGLNEVVHEKPPAVWLQVLGAFYNPFIIVLIIMGIVSFFTDIWLVPPGEKDWTKIILLIVTVSISWILQFWQEFRSQKAVEKLKNLVQNKATVIRKDWDDNLSDKVIGSFIKSENDREIPVKQIVPGDIIRIAAGDMIPVDMRLLSSQDLFLSESALTGESMPVEKFAIPQTPEEIAENERDKVAISPLELNSLCFMGTSVVSGSGLGVAVVTGANAYFSSISKKITGKRILTNFDKGINKVTWLLIYFTLAMVAVIFAINGLFKKSWFDALFFSLALAVGLVPEMLPLVVTTNLAKGAVVMAKKKVIIKKLNAIQNFGAMDILCTDKTGTITEDKVTLIRHLDIKNKESERVLNLAYLNSYFQTGLKNLMDLAVIEYKEEKYPEKNKPVYHKVDEMPFDFSRRRMSVVVQKDKDKHLIICKGAIEEIFSICTKVEQGNKTIDIADFKKKEVYALAQKLNTEGLRVLAVAYKEINKNKEIYSVADEKDLVLAGYIGFLDPPKKSAKKALKLLKQEGVQIKIITGDNEVVTSKICKEVGLKEDNILLGQDIEMLSDQELKALVSKTAIFAKTAPLQKARIVSTLKKAGHVVGYMGDGVNDAAAMYEADVGISVDGGVDIAKEAADIILLENDLGVLQKGIIEGRTVFGNIMKYIKMTMSSTFGNAFSVLIASIFLPFLPMLPIHILIQNLLYDIFQLSIPLDRMNKEFLNKPAQWKTESIRRFMLFIGSISSIFDILTFLMLWFIFKANTVDMQALFHSGWFVESLLSGVLIVHVIRTEKLSILKNRATAPVIILSLIVMILGVTIPFTKIGSSIGFVSLPFTYFPLLFLIVFSYCFLTHKIKKWYINKFKDWI